MEEKGTPQEYDPTADYKVGSFIDSKDTVNTWCVATIVDINRDNKKITVHFDGWSNKWDEVYFYSGAKVAPFRKFSSGYSGQTK